MMQVAGKQTNVFAFKGAQGQGKTTCSQIWQKICQEKLNREIKVVAFSEDLKRGLMAMFRVPQEYFFNPSMKQTIIPGLNVSARQLMECVGTKFVRNLLPKEYPAFQFSLPAHLESKDKKQDSLSYWSYITLKKMETVLKEGNCVIVEDLRFPDEGQIIHRLNGIIFEVERNEAGTEVVSKEGETDEYEEKKKTSKTKKRRRRHTGGPLPSKKKTRTPKKNLHDLINSEHTKIQAHYKISNNGTVEDLEGLLRKLIEPDLVQEDIHTLSFGGATLTKMDFVVPPSKKVSSPKKQVKEKETVEVTTQDARSVELESVIVQAEQVEVSA